MTPQVGQCRTGASERRWLKFAHGGAAPEINVAPGLR
jgi:hypothetical protein